MGTQYLIDSNAVIDYLSGKLPATGMTFLNGLVNDTPKISVITKSLSKFYLPENQHFTNLPSNFTTHLSR